MKALSLEPNGKTYRQTGHALNAARARKISKWLKSENGHESAKGYWLAGFDDDQNHYRNENNGRYFID